MYTRSPFFGPLWIYFGAFTPKEWTRETSLRLPPFKVIETARGYLLLPTDVAKQRLDDIARTPTILTKRSDGAYLAMTDNVMWITHMFLWFVRKSWKNEDYGILWAIIYLVLRSPNEKTRFTTKEISKLTGYDLNKCQERLDKFSGDGLITRSDNNCIADGNAIFELFNEYRKQLPNWTEEKVMGILCADAHMYAKDVCKEMARYGLLESAIYKVIRKLKNENFVVWNYDKQHGKGPAREYLISNCDNCFFGHSSKEKCMEESFDYLKQLIGEIFNKKLGIEESAELEKLKSPNDLRLLRRLNEVLYAIYPLKTNVEDMNGELLDALKLTGIVDVNHGFITFKIPLNTSKSP
jgi:hypothetical protein